MPAVENKENNINSWRKNIDSKVDKEKSLQNSIQNATIKLFPNFSTEEKVSIITQINNYLKLPGRYIQGIFAILVKLKKENPTDSKLAQIIINHIKKLNERTVLDVTNKKNKKLILNWKNTQKESYRNKELAKSTTKTIDIKKKSEEFIKINNESKEAIKIINKETQEKFKRTLELQSSLKPEYQPTQAQITAKVQSLSLETKAKLKSSGLSETDYAKFLASKEALFSAGDNSQESRDFLDSLKELNQSLGIRDLDQMPNSFSIDKQFVKDNPDLVKHIWESQDFKILDNSFDLSWLKNFKEVSTFHQKVHFPQFST